MHVRNFWLSKEVLTGVAAILVLAIPVGVWGGSQTLYVDRDAKGAEEGTLASPYHSLGQALKYAKSGTEVRVKAGTYKENITIPKGVKVVGESKERDKVIIKARDEDQATVTMKDQTALSFVTVKDGRYGVRVVQNAKAHIFDTVIKNSNRDGINIDAAPAQKRYRVLIDNVKIVENKRAGLLAAQRDMVIIKSEIARNGSDGIDLAAGTRAWLADNTFAQNVGTGAKLVLDRTEIWSKKNIFRNNGREGVEVNAYGASGTIGFKKAVFTGNAHYGLARIARTAAGIGTFQGVLLEQGENKNDFTANKMGTMSPIVKGF